MGLPNSNPDGTVTGAMDSHRADLKVPIGWPQVSASHGQQLQDRDQESERRDGLRECSECGHMNPGTNRFCGMCGMGLEDGIGSLMIVSRANQDLEPHFDKTAPSGVRLQHHHHHYHHFAIRHEPYIVVAATLLVIVIAWQQWQVYHRMTISQPIPTPHVRAAKEAKQDTQNNGTKRPLEVPALQNDLEAPMQHETAERRKPLRRQKAERQGAKPVQGAALAPPELASLNLVDNVLPSLVPPSSRVPNMAGSTKMPAKRRLVVSRGASEERLVEKVMPQYPETAAQAGLKGEVVVDAMIGKNGTIRELRLVAGSPVLARAAMDAIRQWRYRPYLVNSEPVEIWTRITMRFGK